MLLRRPKRTNLVSRPAFSPNQSSWNEKGLWITGALPGSSVHSCSVVHMPLKTRRLPSPSGGLCWNILLVLIISVLLQSLLVNALPVAAKSAATRHGIHRHNSQSHHNLHRHQHYHRHKSQPTMTLRPPPSSVSLEAIDASSSLSIVTPLEVLRRNMIQEIQRTRHRQAEDKVVQSNRQYLEKIGK